MINFILTPFIEVTPFKKVSPLSEFVAKFRFNLVLTVDEVLIGSEYTQVLPIDINKFYRNITLNIPLLDAAKGTVNG